VHRDAPASSPGPGADQLAGAARAQHEDVVAPSASAARNGIAADNPASM
jgi:hypothetical protein